MGLLPLGIFLLKSQALDVSDVNLEIKMKSLSSVGLGLSIVFGCLLLALIAELYYLLWWKKRFVTRDIENDCSNPAGELFCMFCWKRASSSSSSLAQKALNPQEIRIRDTLVQGTTEYSNKDLLLRPFGEENHGMEQLQMQCLGPPRFLFTIVEETKEDLESEDPKSRKGSRGRSLSSDVVFTLETPYLTPIASPSFFTPPLTPMESPYSHHQGFNPLFESTTDAEFNRLRSSPPPKFKFLQDAEEKMYKKKLMEETACRDEEEGSFITIERKFLHQNNHHSC